jgi:hypothetical protein
MPNDLGSRTNDLVTRTRQAWQSNGHIFATFSFEYTSYLASESNPCIGELYRVTEKSKIDEITE